MNTAFQEPPDWADPKSCEAHYASLRPNDSDYQYAVKSCGSFPLSRINDLLGELRELGCLRVWFPGCGLSPLPRALSLLGFDVYATDIASSAIQYQAENTNFVRSLLDEASLGSTESAGDFFTSVHDLRVPLGVSVDVVLNVKAFQWLPEDGMTKAAQSHFDALRDGGLAIFDTLNLQGETRDLVEESLVGAGFYLPLHEYGKAYRDELSATRIPYMMVFGDKPVIPSRDDYPYPHKVGSPERNRDRDVLRDIEKRYRAGMEAAYREEQASLPPEPKTAQVIYSTG